MTVNTTSVRDTYLGNGVATQFSYNFKIIDQTQMVVELTLLSTGAITTLNDSQYSVTGIGTDGGVVTYPLSGSPLASTYSITIRREVALTQDTVFTNQTTYYPDVVEQTFDVLTMEVQQVQDEVDRALVLGPTDIDGSGSYRANGNRIQDLGAPTGNNDAVRLVDVQGIVVSAGNVPAPTGGQTNQFLRAGAASTFGWYDKFQMDTAGNAGFGGAVVATVSAAFQKTITGGTTAFGAQMTSVTQSDVTNVSIGFQMLGATLAGAWTLANYFGFDVGAPTKGAGSTVTYSVGYNVASTFVWGTNNRAFQGLLPAGANNRNLYMAGNAINWLAGALMLGGADRAAVGMLDVRDLGITVGNPTGGDKGDGTVNAKNGFYKNGNPIGQTIPVRQSVLCGPVDGTTGLANFLPATSVSLNLTTTGVSASAPFIATAANACDAGASVDRVGYSAANLTWNGLAALSTNFLYVDIDSTGAITTGATTLAPVYQQGGARSVVNGQFTFNIGEMYGTVGNGAAAAQTYRVFVGEAVTNAGTVTSTVAYAYLGKTVVTSAALALTTTYNPSHNLGVIPRDIHMMFVCNSAELNYAVGSEVVPLSQPGSSFGVSYGVYDRLTLLALSGSGAIGHLVVAGTATAMTPAKWYGRWYVTRGW